MKTKTPLFLPQKDIREAVTVRHENDNNPAFSKDFENAGFFYRLEKQSCIMALATPS